MHKTSLLFTHCNDDETTSLHWVRRPQLPHSLKWIFHFLNKCWAQDQAAWHYMAATMLQIIFMQQVRSFKRVETKEGKDPFVKGTQTTNKHRLLFPRFKDLFRQRLKLILFVAFATVEMVESPRQHGKELKRAMLVLALSWSSGITIPNYM